MQKVCCRLVLLKNCLPLRQPYYLPKNYCMKAGLGGFININARVGI